MLGNDMRLNFVIFWVGTRGGLLLTQINAQSLGSLYLQFGAFLLTALRVIKVAIIVAAILIFLDIATATTDEVRLLVTVRGI